MTVRPFRYLADPLFLAAVALYAANRFALEPAWPNPFLYGQLNDLLCIPVWVPILVAVLRQTGLRTTDDPPGAAEIAVPLVVWAGLFEVVLPRWNPHHFVADPADVAAYAAGALGARAFWDAWYAGRPSPDVHPAPRPRIR